MKVCIVLSFVLAFSSLSNAAVTIKADSFTVTSPDPLVVGTTAAELTFSITFLNDADAAVNVEGINLYLADGTDLSTASKSEAFAATGAENTFPAEVAANSVDKELTGLMATVTADDEKCSTYTQLCAQSTPTAAEATACKAVTPVCTAAATTQAPTTAASGGDDDDAAAGLTVSVVLTVVMAVLALISLNM
ncbi:uncharacterized protein LOC144450167 [Glandiceps talaboti]